MALRSGSRPWSTLRVFLVTFQAALIPLSATAADFYVNPSTGSNGNNGFTPGTAWKTITFALTQVPAGATLNLMPGIYSTSSGEGIPIQPSFSISMIGSGESNTIIAGETDPSADNTINLIQADAVFTLSHLSVTGGGNGIFVRDAEVHLNFVEVHDNVRTSVYCDTNVDFMGHHIYTHDDNQVGFHVGSGSVELRESRFVNSAYQNVIFGGSGVKPHEALVTGCFFARSGRVSPNAAIALGTTGELEIRDSVFVHANGDAIANGTGTVIVQNCLLLNCQVGIDNHSQGVMRAFHNVVCGNLFDSVFIRSLLPFSIFSGNLVVGNGGQGIVFLSGAKKFSSHNTVSRNANAGFYPDLFTDPMI